MPWGALTLNAQLAARQQVVVVDAVVVVARLGVAPMAQTIPLAADLRVEADFVVITIKGVVGLGAPVDNLVLECVPSKGLLAQPVQAPVECHAVAGLDLVTSGLDDFWCQQVQRAELVLDAVLVKEAPGAAMPTNKRWLAGVLSVCVVLHPWRVTHGLPSTLGKSFQFGSFEASMLAFVCEE